jgi:mRNA-degrading endonuclease RelE of RelBE toxin-antitoxin system
VKSQITDDFLVHYKRLPDNVREQVRKAYRFWRTDPSHPSLHFKRIHAKEPLYSVRVSLGWRVLGLLEHDTITWFWIGSHAEYDRIISTF